MDVRLLTDTIVRQTTVLLAQIATAAGVRAPLAHLANQVFGDLAKELEAQGVRRTVVAEMFGLALRSYEIKMRRLEETTEVQRSAWRAVYSKLEQHSQTRLQLTKSLPNVAARDLSAILNDLVDSGLVYRSGAGTRAVYGVTSDVDWSRREAEDELQTLTNLIWLTLATRGNQGRSALEAKFRSDSATFEAAIDELVASKRIEVHTGGSGIVYAAQSFHIPVGAEQGWEAAVCDHFGAVATAIAAKLHSPQTRTDDLIGGSTLRFTVYPGHPLEAEVKGLLSHVRSHAEALWQRVHQHNQTVSPSENAEKFTFYYGQNHTFSETTSNES
jgi:DNA-binding HxlR family transcriptional regulator